MKTVVLGSGGWGTALSLVLHRNGHPVTLWSHVPEKAAYMERARENPRLEGVPLPPELRLTADMVCLTEAELVVVAVPSYAVRETAHAAAPLLRPDTLLVTAAKGIERDTHLRMSQILEQETGGAFPIAALSGPSHAEEVGRGLPTGCVAASVSKAAALTVQDAFMNDRFRVYTSPDIVGVELSGALKNVVALACGICDGMGYQDNTKALLMTRAMVELCHLGERLGGDRQTFGGLAGMGDLIVTCTSMHSRNRRAGILLGQGKSVGQTLAETGGVVEGYYAANCTSTSSSPGAVCSTSCLARVSPVAVSTEKPSLCKNADSDAVIWASSSTSRIRSISPSFPGVIPRDSASHPRSRPFWPGS